MTGVLASQQISALVESGAIRLEAPLVDGQIQPASLDLRLGTEAIRVRASFLAGEGRTLASRIDEFEMHRVDLTEGAVLEKGCVYVVPLLESVLQRRLGIKDLWRKVWRIQLMRVGT